MDEQHLDSAELASFFSRVSRGEIFPAVCIPPLISASETLLFTLDAIIPKSVNVACTVSSDLYRGSQILRGISMRMRRYKTMSQSFRPFSTNNFHFHNNWTADFSANFYSRSERNGNLAIHKILFLLLNVTTTTSFRYVLFAHNARFLHFCAFQFPTSVTNARRLITNQRLKPRIKTTSSSEQHTSDFLETLKILFSKLRRH